MYYTDNAFLIQNDRITQGVGKSTLWMKTGDTGSHYLIKMAMY